MRPLFVFPAGSIEHNTLERINECGFEPIKFFPPPDQFVPPTVLGLKEPQTWANFEKLPPEVLEAVKREYLARIGPFCTRLDTDYGPLWSFDPRFLKYENGESVAHAGIFVTVRK